MRKLSRKAFAKWLESKEPQEKVGVPCHTRACPIANFMNENSPHRDYYVNGLYFGVATPTRVTNNPTPQWARDFMRIIDIEGEDMVTADMVTAGEALRALNIVAAQ